MQPASAARESREGYVPAPDSTLADALSGAAAAAGVEDSVCEATSGGEDSPGEAVTPEVAAGEEAYAITQKAIEMLRTVYDPEIPVNVYDLGLIYRIDFTEPDRVLHVDMTLTAPGCPAADFILEDVRQKLLSVDGPKAVDLRLVFEPEWNQDMMSEEAKLELGFL